MVDWRSELRGLLDSVPGGALRLIRAIDEGRLSGGTYGYVGECGTVGCVYGHVYEDAVEANAAARVVNPAWLTPLEKHLIWNKTPELREEVVCWLAEHGETPEPSHPSHPSRSVAEAGR